MVSRLSAIVLLAALLVVSARGAEEVLDGIAAVVNNNVITFSQVRELVSVREQTLRETLKGQQLIDKVKELRLSAINDLIDRQLVLDDFEKNKFQMPDYVIDDHIQTIIREQFNGDRLTFIRTLQAQGYTLQRFRKVETDKMIVQAMRQRNVKVNTIISPARIEKYYEQHRTEYSTPEQVKLRMIVIHKDTPNAESTASELCAKIKDGDDFAKMASMYSEDSSKDVGGDWGWIDRSTLDKNLSDAAFSLKPGRISKVINVNGNCYILYVDARKSASTKPLDSIHDDVSAKILQEERQAAQEKWIKTLRAKAFVKIY